MASDLKRKRAARTETHGGKRRNVSAERGEHSAFSDAKNLADTHLDGSKDEEPENTEPESGSDEENEWAGMDSESDEGPPAHNANGRVGRSGMPPKQVPKGEELRDISDAASLYRSTSFKLQIDALLPNVRPKYGKSSSLDHFLLSLYTFLNSLPSKPLQHPLAASRHLLKRSIAVAYPLPVPTEETNWTVAFEKPSEILLVGSWALKTSVKAKDGHRYGVDVAVAMPDSLFQEKDYMHSRFFHKRAYYLAVIAAAIASKKSPFDMELSYESTFGDPRLTNLIIRPKHDGSQNDFSNLNAEVHIIPVLSPTSPIPLHRLSPSRSNIRTSDDASKDAPSPLYNSSLLQCMAYKSHFLSMHAVKEAVPAFNDALALLRVWANQRGYGVGNRLCVRGFEGRGDWWASLLEMLVNGEEPLASSFSKASAKRKAFGKGLSSYQLFKAALDFLAKHDFSKERVFVKTKDGHRFSPDDYRSHEAVFVDSTSMRNLLAAVPLGSLAMLRYDAQQTLQLLDNSPITEDPFVAVLLKELRDVSSRFDVVARVDLTSAKLRKVSQQAILEHGSAYNALLAELVSYLQQGLGNRAKAIVVLHPTSQHRKTSQAHPSNPSIIYIGLILDIEHAFRLVDHGPPAAEQESEAAQQFRDLWGEKAELRRFKDGSIVESVVWMVTNPDERAHIPAMIMRHILKRHCGIDETAVQTWQASFDGVLRLPESIAAKFRANNGPIGFKAAMTAFDQLVRTMKALEGQIPLSILTVSPVTDTLRYTSTLNPVAISASLAAALPPCARYIAPMEVVIEFERSGRWPDDLRAIQKIKLAFFEALATALMAAHKGLRATVVLSDGTPASEIQDQAFLEIVTVDGWAFRARIRHDREATLLQRLIEGERSHIPKHLQKDEDIDPKARQEALAALEVYRRRFVHGPRHHRAVAAMCHRFTAFAGTVRLVKRWLGSHWLLKGHVSGEAAELLCAHVFFRCGTVGVPGTKERGFARVVEWLKDWDWSAGVYVPVYGAAEDVAVLGEEEKAQVTVTADARVGVWAVATELDPDGHVWTRAGPDAVVARRVRALAQATWECLQGIERDVFDVLVCGPFFSPLPLQQVLRFLLSQTLFAHPTEHYDFLIEFDPTVLPRYAQNVRADPAVWETKGKYANAKAIPASSSSAVLPGFDPVQALSDDLQRVYKDTFVLFYDPLGGDKLGGVWDPRLNAPRSFRVLGGFSSMPAYAVSTFPHAFPLKSLSFFSLITDLQDADKVQSKSKAKEKEKDKSLVALNEVAVLSEVERMGAGMITRIVRHI
ncbi:Nrap protein [Laetiporus sulphureus 93-53]|uniref:U3 small nucleolar RNA-associated protein 22 n=1 Tax=Laetiporus sulphureus 93-53 TaxID=1314785 RepID=A0A165B684_9APHY|nr:Nrap protein [Laetiporus sulphureus 93-53]KZT00334.1 Nrap protein [Laetiporus sulphureus 93-53]